MLTAYPHFVGVPEPTPYNALYDRPGIASVPKTISGRSVILTLQVTSVTDTQKDGRTDGRAGGISVAYTAPACIESHG